ncbi:glycosyltransferase family 2 protein [Halobacillus amylolyticus]|uniref:Glycosyltransferase n=1 Tax=Halobacillus amylolyticus TaxID=2932259 RepID=A0ABY4HGB2_9BACI|nr:glycosyltransferase [Halobacillus amylolyticus]UOR13784.1 glycosyltransferase [Halobacillus amylolyticus]
MNPQISIVVPVFNVENFIRKCIESIQQQQFERFELILINDGSTDDSGKICEEYARTDKRIRVIHKQNGGVSSSRNVGIKNSKGDYIGFVDSDDLIEKEMYQKMYEVLKTNNADIVSCGYRETSDFSGATKEFVKPLNGKESIKGKQIMEDLEFLLTQNKILGYASVCNKLYKKTLIDNNNMLMNEKISIAEDLCFNINAFSCADSISAVNEALYIYRRVNENSIMNQEAGSFYLHLDARREMLKALRGIKISNKVYITCVCYENSKTTAEYLDKILIILSSSEKYKEKFQQINKLVHEQYFTNALANYNSRYLVMKAKVILKLMKLLLILEGRLCSWIIRKGRRS